MSSRLGPYALGPLLGRGAMASVYEGTHVELDAPVAIKVMTAAERTRVSQEGLVREIRAMAALTHPGIVTVHDYGFLGPEPVVHADDTLAPRSPYLVMERALEGTLEDRMAGRPASGWSEVRQILVAILDALAHAHARGLVHRDVKPSNVLFTGGAPRALKLADFGLSRRLDDASEDGAISGTPHYMAPEQILGRARELGPWTDLYALGCVACQLLSGRPPFAPAERAPAAILHAHLVGVPPKLEGSHPVPTGFDAWLSAMLAKSPALRFRRAADAAHALRALSTDPLALAEDGAPTATPAVTLGSTKPGALLEAEPGSLAPEDYGVTAPTLRLESRPAHPMALHASGRAPAAPWPGEWRTHGSLHSAPMAGVGLGLFGLRSIPMLGREAERDLLWGVLHETVARSAPRGVVLRGLPGAGKSRLAGWLCERAHELGVARVLDATHGEHPAAPDGVLPMLERAVRAVGLHDESELSARIHAELEGLLEEDEADVLSALVGFFRDARRGDRAPGDRSPIVIQLLRVLCRERALVLWLDDVHHGLEALELAHRLLTSARDLPICVVATVRDDLISARPEEAKALAALRPHATEIEVGPLEAAEHRRLVRWLLGLEHGLVDRVAERTDGRPLFAVQLVGDWVQRGDLVAGPDGFRLRPGANLELPDDIHALWKRRVAQLDERFGGDTLACLEIAAALGHALSESLWLRACQEAGRTLPGGLLGAMLEARLARVTEAGFALSHSMLRESLSRSAQAHHRWRDAHGACARALERIHGFDAEVAEAIALHYEQAGELRRALGPLDRAIRHSISKSRADHAGVLGRRRELLLSGLFPDEMGTAWAEHHLAGARLARIAGDLDATEARTDAAERADPKHPGVAFRRADLAWMRGGALEAELPRLRAALAEAQTRGMDEVAQAVLMKLVHFSLDLGRVDPAFEARLAEEERLGHERGSSHREVGALVGITRLAAVEGDLDRALDAAERAAAVARGAGHRFDVALAHLHLGETYCLGDDHAAALRALERAVAEWQACGSGLSAVAECYLAGAESMAGRDALARARLARLGAQKLVRTSRLRGLLAYVRLTVAARAGDRAAVEDALADAEEVTPAAGRASHYLAACAASAHAHLEPTHPDLAERAGALAALHRRIVREAML